MRFSGEFQKKCFFIFWFFFFLLLKQNHPGDRWDGVLLCSWAASLDLPVASLVHWGVPDHLWFIWICDHVVAYYQRRESKHCLILIYDVPGRFCVMILSTNFSTKCQVCFYWLHSLLLISFICLYLFDNTLDSVMHVCFCVCVYVCVCMCVCVYTCICVCTLQLTCLWWRENVFPICSTW